jgi:hypothetical protein
VPLSAPRPGARRHGIRVRRAPGLGFKFKLFTVTVEQAASAPPPLRLVSEPGPGAAVRVTQCHGSSLTAATQAGSDRGIRVSQGDVSGGPVTVSESGAARRATGRPESES